MCAALHCGISALLAVSLLTVGCAGGSSQQEAASPSPATPDLPPGSEEVSESQSESTGTPTQGVPQQAEETAPPERDLGDTPPFAAAATCQPTEAASVLRGARLRRVLRSMRRDGLPAGVGIADLTGSCEVSLPDIARALNQAGLDRLNRRELDSAHELLRAAVTVDPSYLAARFNFIAVAALQGRVVVSMTHLRELAGAGEEARQWLGQTLTDSDFAALHERADYWELLTRVAGNRDGEPGRGDLDGTSLRSYVPSQTVIPIEGLSAPPAGGDRVSRADIDFERVRPLLSAGQDDPPEYHRSSGLTIESLPVTVQHTHPRWLRGISWWRPIDTRVFLVIPYRHRDRRNMTEGFVVYERVQGGVRFVYREAMPSAFADFGTNEERVRAYFSAMNGTELGVVDGWTGGATHCRLRLAAGALRRICSEVHIPSLYQ